MDCAVLQDYSNISGDAQPVFTDTLSSFPWRRKWQHTLVGSCLENPMDGGAWQATVHGSLSQT